MDYNTGMNYEEFSGKSVLLLGKTRSLNTQEFETLLNLHGIMLLRRYESGIALIIEGKLMNPLEQEESASLYALGAAPIIDIASFEQWLCGSIEPNRLLMSLKLSNDQERLVDFIKNPYISNPLFFKLLKLYYWQNEGFFDNDSNRDVTASIIGRFYKDLERNHNVQYAMSGLAHLIERYGTGELIEAISELAPIQKELKTSGDRSLFGVLDAMAIHPETNELILRALLKERASVLAQRVPLSLEKELLALNDSSINTLLASNESLSVEASLHLEADYPKIIAAHTLLDEERFARLAATQAEALASNLSCSLGMQRKLFETEESAVLKALAMNPSLDEALLGALYKMGGFHPELASNPSLALPLLEELSCSAEAPILLGLSANPSTPVEILYQLSLDQRFERSVKTNPSFGRHIQTYNIGWQE